MLLKALKQRNIGRHKLPPGKVNLSGRGFGRHDLGAIDPLHLQIVDIGQLVAFRIHLEIVRIAAQQGARRGPANQYVRRQYGAVEVNQISRAVDRPEIGEPVLQTQLFGLALQLRGIGEIRVVAAHKVRRHHQARTVVSEVVDKQRHRLGKVITKTVRVVLFDSRALESRLHHRRKLLVHQHVIEPERVVISRYGMAVGPLVAGAQSNPQGPRAVEILGLCRKIRQIQPHLRPRTQHPLGHVDQAFTSEKQPGRAPVAANLAERFDDHRVIG